MRPEPIRPELPEDNDLARFELIKAMGVAIAAISKEKAVFISEAEVKRNGDDYMELTIKCVVPEDKNRGETYNKALRTYYREKEVWEKETRIEKHGLTEEGYQEAENRYVEYCKSTDYSRRITKDKWYETTYPQFFNAPIIEVQ